MMEISGKTPDDFLKYRKKIITKARKLKMHQDYLFVTTLHRYDMQVSVMCELEKNMAEMDSTITKTYVKGRENVVINPVITEYNRTASAANKTAETLMKMIKSADDAKEAGKEKKSSDPLAKIMDMDDDEYE